VTLAGSFALLAVVPLVTFAELAFAMAVGLLIDTFVVRSILTPSLLTLVGTVSGWPGRRLHRHTSRAAPDPPSETEQPVAASAMNSTAYPPYPPRARRGSRRLPPRRVILSVLVVLVAYALVGWGLDWASRIGAQSLIARSIQHAEHLAIRPQVEVRGWFFVPHVVTGRYKEVDVRVQGVQDGALRLADIRAQLYGVHVPLHDVVARDVTAVPVDRTHETVTLAYADVNAYLHAEGQSLTVSAGPSGQVKITAHTAVLGHPVSVSADADITAIPGHLEVRPTQLDTGGPIDSASRALLGRRLTIDIPTAPLPFGQRVLDIRPGADSIVVEAAGHHIVLARPES
jgi:hypothetical protein